MNEHQDSIGATCADEGRLTRAVVSRLMEIGIAASVLFITAGIVVSLAGGTYGDCATLEPGGDSGADSKPIDLGAIFRGAFSLDGRSLLLVGLILFILTPFMRVAVSFVSFVIERDLVFALLTAYVLTILTVSFFLGKAK